MLSEDLTCCRMATRPEALPGPAVLRIRRDIADGLDVSGMEVVAEDTEKIHFGLERSLRGDGSPVQIKVIALWLDDIPVDLHVDLFKMGIPCRRPTSCGNAPPSRHCRAAHLFRVPDPETSLIHFLLHLNRDGFRNLLGYVDVLRILQREDLDWDYIDRFVRAEGIQTPVYMALRAVVTTLEESDLARFEATGVRAQIWRFVWRPGRSTARPARRLPLCAPRPKPCCPCLRADVSLKRWRGGRRWCFLHGHLSMLLHPTTTGPYLWRLIKG